MLRSFRRDSSNLTRAPAISWEWGGYSFFFLAWAHDAVCTCYSTDVWLYQKGTPPMQTADPRGFHLHCVARQSPHLLPICSIADLPKMGGFCLALHSCWEFGPASKAQRKPLYVASCKHRVVVAITRRQGDEIQGRYLACFALLLTLSRRGTDTVLQ